MSQVAVVGAGYVGLTTAAFLAELGHDVACGDIDADRVDALSRGVSPILEEGLESAVRRHLEWGRLRFVHGAAAAAEGREFVFLCVPTPQHPSGEADMSFIEAAAREIGPVLSRGAVVINKSTVPVGSTLVVEAELGRGDVSVVSNPEFIREGSALHDSRNPDRIVIGSEDQAAAIRVAGLFRGVDTPLLVTDPASAETIKYASNAFLATKISFVNAIANLCEAVGADIGDVLLGLGYDHRIGFELLRPGPGWGGSCLPKDTAALVRIGENHGYDFALLRGVIAVNEEQHSRVASKVVELAGGSVEGSLVAAWGLTFKAHTDDLRGSPALAVLERLVSRGARVQAYDPAVRGPLSGLEVRDDPYAACEGASVLVVLTEWEEFRWIDLRKVAELMAQPALVDARNLLDPRAVRRAGFTYSGVGRV